MTGAAQATAAGTATATSTVAFGPTAATSVTYHSPTSLTAVSPAGPLPTVTGLSASTGSSGGGTSVTITGNYFTPASTVAFGANAELSVTYNSETSLIAVSPPGAGMVDVKVTTVNGTSTTSSADQFTYAVTFAATWEYGASVFENYASSSTFPASSTFSIGTASADRIVAVAVYNSYRQAPTSVTICGATGIAVTGTFVVNTEEYYAPVPSGTTCSIVVNGTNQKDEGVEVWSIHGQSGGAAATPSGGRSSSPSRRSP